MLNERSVFCEITVPATIPEVWQAWTTETGTESFFSRKCKIDLRPGGAYEMLFNQDSKPGEQGGEGMIIMSIQPEKMLSFTWNAPPNLPQVRGQMTHVVVRLFEANSGLPGLPFTMMAGVRGENGTRLLNIFFAPGVRLFFPG